MRVDEIRNASHTVYTLWLREMLRFKRSKSRIIGSIATPLFFLVFLGSALDTAIDINGVSYIDYMAPGIIAMSILFSSLTGGISIIWDREFGYLKEILIAPVSRFYTALGKAVGGVTTAMIQGVILMVIAGLIGVNYISALGQIISILIMLLIGLGFIGLGISIASKIESIEGFQLVMTFLTFPLLMASSAFYPITDLPTWIRIIVLLNPLTYGIESLRWALIADPQISPFVSITVIALFAISMVMLGGWSFNKVNT
ncbi:ABC transporter permease [Methanosalsum natronophilum]|uniref:Multidrug ABC transporter permease n=1 Tax=Methanosalsum natronophilum TaxID=768733 RepID=A0A3R7XHK6_9EURY|nr:ABC transporter permease [Methanosalsum natronophilum]MCS3923529.1 ABC-2 type transport system permease protein [Methanosalsum natronophilum]RQD84132.1 MAG: multidrug ABC transporter permease [Methanosalsum natronophilum]